MFSTPSGNQTKVTIPQGVPSEETKHFVPHFVPETLTVAKGTNVEWTNDDNALHTVTSGSSDGLSAAGSEFDSSYLSQGDVFNYTFDKNGTYKYFCTLHSYMTAEVVVSEDGASPISNDTDSTPFGSYNSSDFQITNMSLVDESDSLFGYLAIVGFVRNIGNETYGDVKFVVTLYDKNNRLIDVAEGYPSLSSASSPGGITPFKIPISTTPAKLHHYVVQVGAIDLP